MALSSVRFFSRIICTTPYKSSNRTNALVSYKNFHFNITQKNLIQPTVLPIYLSQRWVHYKRKPTKFPPDDIITRNEKLMQKLNPMDERLMEKEVPTDHGYKTDSSGQIFSSFIPRKDKSAKYFWESAKAKMQSTYAIAKIKKQETRPFNVIEFAKTAQKKFIDLNNDLQLAQKKSIELRMEEYATLDVLIALKKQFGNPGKKVYWRFVKEVERPRVVNCAVAQAPDSKDDFYAQITVRMCTDQILAIQDRYDRLILGSLKKPKQVIDFVVFERLLSDSYGNWRVCGKINAK